MDRQLDLPGIESLFREQQRLAQKLSREELSALRRYLRGAVHAECESVVARMRYLQSAQDANEAQYQRALGSLQKDLRLQKTVAGEFRREFGSLARVLEARERRWREKQDALEREVERGRGSVESALKAKQELEVALQQKDKELDRQKDAVVDLEDELANHKDCHHLRQQLTQLHKDLLKAKLDNDKHRTELGAGERTTTTTTVDKDAGRRRVPGGGGTFQTASHTKQQGSPASAAAAATTRVRFSTPLAAPPAKHSPMTFTPVTPYCTTSTCRARQDLEECRVQFIKKCEEVVALRTALEEQKKTTKTSRERTSRRRSRTQELGPCVDNSPSTADTKPSAVVQPLKPGYREGREFSGPRGHHSSARLCASLKSLKLRPAYQ